MVTRGHLASCRSPVLFIYPRLMLVAPAKDLCNEVHSSNDVPRRSGLSHDSASTARNGFRKGQPSDVISICRPWRLLTHNYFFFHKTPTFPMGLKSRSYLLAFVLEFVGVSDACPAPVDI